jgi:imidazoleglycerol phosphate dehydratase HisB
LERALGSIGLAPLGSSANFLFVPVSDPEGLRNRLLDRGLAVRAVPEGIRVSVRDPGDDDELIDALGEILGTRPMSLPGPQQRTARFSRATTETRIAVRLRLEGDGRASVSTGAGIYDHFFEQLGFHAGFDLFVTGSGDEHTGPHHVAEDTALAIGSALDRALADRAGVARYGNAVVPMDDALANAAVDLGGRSWAEVELSSDPGLAGHVLRSFSQTARLALHVEGTGRDPHHIAEAAFKAVGRALKDAVRQEATGVPSTKGVL